MAGRACQVKPGTFLEMQACICIRIPYWLGNGMKDVLIPGQQTASSRFLLIKSSKSSTIQANLFLLIKSKPSTIVANMFHPALIMLSWLSKPFLSYYQNVLRCLLEKPACELPLSAPLQCTTELPDTCITRMLLTHIEAPKSSLCC
eukprot:scaffold159890_cov14-Tisochrysis_lutea.AAC.1